MPEKSRTYEKAAPRVYIRTFGCQMNDADSEVMERLLEREGVAGRAHPRDWPGKDDYYEYKQSCTPT